MLNFIKYHWFGLLISTAFGLFLVQFFIVLFAPHHDLQNRGFVPCTNQMAEQVETCNYAKICVLKAVSDNTFCDTKVIVSGFSKWIKGEQPRPWSNYFFVPEYPQQTEDPDEELEEFYKENPDLQEQMQKIKQQYLELEKKNDEARKAAGVETE